MSREQGGSGSGSFFGRAGTGAPPPQGHVLELPSWRRGQASGSGVPQQASHSTINQGLGRESGPQHYDGYSSGIRSNQHRVPQQAGHHQWRYHQVENQQHPLQPQAAASNQPRYAGDVGTQSEWNASAGPAYQRQRPTLSGTEAPATSDGPERPTIFKEEYAATYPPRPVRDSNVSRRALKLMPKPKALDENIQVIDIDDDSDEAADSASKTPASAKANGDNHVSGNVPKTEETLTWVTVLNQIAKADETLISADIIYHPEEDPAIIREAESILVLPQFDDGCTIVVGDTRCDISRPDDLAQHQKEAEECSNEKSVTESAATVTEASNNRDSVAQEDPVALTSSADSHSHCEDLSPSHPTTLVETTSSGNMQQAGIGNLVPLEQGVGETDSEKNKVEDDNKADEVFDATPSWNHVSNVQLGTEVRYEDINSGEFVEEQNPAIFISASDENGADPVPGCSKAMFASVGVHEEVEDESYIEDLSEDTIRLEDKASNSVASQTKFEPSDEGMEQSVEDGWSSIANCVPQNLITFIPASEPEQTVSGIPPFVETGLDHLRAKGVVSEAFIGLCRKRNYQVPSLSRLVTLKRKWALRARRHASHQRSGLVSYFNSMMVISRVEVQKAKICFIGPGYLRSFLAGEFTAFFNQGPENVHRRNSENLEEFLDLNDRMEDRFQVGKFVYLIDCDCDKRMKMDQIMKDLTLLTGRIKFKAQLLVVCCRSICNTSVENIHGTSSQFLQNSRIMENRCKIQRQFSVGTRILFKDDQSYVRAFLKTLKISLEMNALGLTHEILKSEFRRVIQSQL